jgi:hypothetical protein
MAVPKLVSLIALFGIIVAEAPKYLRNRNIDGPAG